MADLVIFVSCVFYLYFLVENFGRHTVDGSELLRSPVEVGNLSHYLQAYNTSEVVG